MIDYAATYDIRDNNMSMEYVSLLHGALQTMNRLKKESEIKLSTIRLRYVKYDNLDLKQDFMDQFSNAFQALGWSIHIDDKDLVITAYDNKLRV